MHKSRSEYRDGFKAHVAVEPETGIITAAALTPANAADGPTGVGLLDGEAPRPAGLRRLRVRLGEVRVELRRRRHDAAIKPIPLRRAIPGGFDRDDFTVDHRARTATCPAGHTVPITPCGSATFGARCHDCPLRDRCTTSQERPHPPHRRARRRARLRPPRLGRRRLRRATTANGGRWSNDPSPGSSPEATAESATEASNATTLGLTHRVAALNLRRLINLGLNHNGRRWTLA